MLIKRVKETIKTHNLIEKGDYIVVGLSGGPDSLCLFDVLYYLKDEFELNIEAVHINHGLRKGAADEDQKFVEEFCKARDVVCHTFVYDCNRIAASLGMSSEEAGRKLRYEAFDEVAENIKATLSLAPIHTSSQNIKIAIAQNANDQAETLLFRLVRGTGPDGLAGIEYSRSSEKGFQIIRPLLDASRTEIEKYCEEKRLAPCIDKTNYEAIYTRNKIRLELIPYIEKNLNPDINEALTRLARTAAEDKEYFWKKTEEEYENAKIEIPMQRPSHDEEAGGEVRKSEYIALDLKKVQEMPASLRHRVILKAFGDIGLDRDIKRVNIEAGDALVEEGKSGSRIDFPYGYSLRISYEKLIFENSLSQIGDMIDETGFSNTYTSDKRSHIRLAEKIEEGHEEGLEKGDNGQKHRSYKIILSRWESESFAGSDCSDSSGKISENPTKQTKELQAVFDFEKLIEAYGDAENIKPVIRTRQNGDYIALPNGGTKKLQDLLVDAKIDKIKRDELLLVCIGREILLVLGDEFTGQDTGFSKTRFSGNYRKNVSKT